MAIAVTRILARQSTSGAAGARPAADSWVRASRAADEPTTTLRADHGLPHEMAFRVVSVSRRAPIRQVDVEADDAAVLADWWERGRVELMAGGRPFVLETDLDGHGIRLVEPMGREPVAAFEPARRGGRVYLPDGATLRWLAPTRTEFSSGFAGHQDVNIIRFALDGTALVLVDPEAFDSGTVRAPRVSVAGSGHIRRGDVADPRLGWVPDVVALLVLGWFLRLVGAGVVTTGQRRSTVDQAFDGRGV